MTVASRSSYDHRLKQAIVATGNPNLFPELSIPRSTRRSWMSRGVADVVSFDCADDDIIALRATVAKLRGRIAILTALVRLLVVWTRVSGLSLEKSRVSSANAKSRILRAVVNAERVIGRHAALKVVGLSEGKLRAWKRRQRLCTLDDAPPCPRITPGRLTQAELGKMRDMVESVELKHFSLRSLSLHAQRLGEVFASYGTWCRMVRVRGWLRPRRRLYPCKPKVGLRATRPNEWFHVDVTIVRLLDGTRCYLHAVIDGFSRRVLAWTLQPRLSAEGTRQILKEAMDGIDCTKVNVLTDGGSENTVIGSEAELVELAEHVVAQVDVVYSNSLIERLWYQLRHNWLYLHQLDSFAALERLVATYFQDHNTRIPLHALLGRTPDEAYFEREMDLPDRLVAQHRAARQNRILVNRAARCSACPSSGDAEPGGHASVQVSHRPVR